MQEIFFPSTTETIAGNLLIANNRETRGMLILHGGGEGNKERYRDLQYALFHKGITSLAIDFRGVGESTGNFEDGSLMNRLHDTKAALQELKKYAHAIGIFGSSMGGFLVPFLLEDHDVKVAVLASAAAYSPDSENKPLNQSFTRAITKPESWKTSRSFNKLARWHGKLLVIYGQFDTKIPDWIKNKYQNITMQLQGKFFIIPGAKHSLMAQITEHDQKAKSSTIEIVSEFAKNNI